ncbi:hypothetical protein QF042_003741 [Pedobacter sp. W3I1]|uniref:hypothetical protein n=1 Tax=Pedobacter sp. W3I1 TaxID=3042291 RepID=UPI00277E4566|nr:hypothetical protein [Pedobacter sp. W3I1]MDQ0640176.1 hypothetical protein [Pedobacter sp. W3I1]
MDFQLDYFRQIIYLINNNLSLDDDDLTTQTGIEEETQRIIKKIDTHQPNNISTFTDFIHFQLGALTRTAKEIENIVSFKGDLTDDLEKLLESMLNGIETIIWHIHTYFRDQFDYNTILTKKTVSDHLKQLDITIEEYVLLFKKSNIDQELIEILLDALYLRLADPPRFRHLAFSDQLLNYLHRNVKKHVPKETLINNLISWKFNHPRFFEYYLHNISGKLRDSVTISEHFRELIFLKKQICQVPIENTISYTPLLPQINLSLLQMLESELDFMKQLDFLNSELMNSGILDAKYKVSLSVKQLAYLIFLAVEVGIITERKAKRVHEYIISHVSTTETERISEKSFSNGYYVPSSVDIGIVSDKLAEMLAKAQSQF